jgi:serine/threonine-protein kinase
LGVQRTPPHRLITALADRYRLERELGQGGMATVYLAQDLRHDRKVAVKVLRPELAAVIGAERFLSEIKTTANLQHPHILPLFDSGAAGQQGSGAEGFSFLYYVMPYVEGESLRDRLNREKQLPIGDAARVATEVASALDYAHRHHVIHRDIKPENILLHDGRALVADFGIALAASKAGGSRMTETGMSLGTPHYMSPEQAMGEREITARSDVYALGCVLYEMLLGEPPFTGPTAQAIVAKVMTAEPAALSPQRKSIPPAVEDAVLTALEKLPADRFASAAEFAEALSGGSTPSVSSRSTSSLRTRPAAPLPRLLLVGLAVALSLASFSLWYWGRAQAASSGAIVRFEVGFPPGVTLSSSMNNPLAISPDGETLVFSGRTDGGLRQLWTRKLSSLDAQVVPGTEGADYPFFSPDGKWLGFLANHQIRKVPLAGGPSIPVADLAGFFFGASWGTGDRIAISRGNRLAVVSAGGGPVTPLSAADTSVSRLMYFPRALPDGKSVVVTRWVGTRATAALWLATVDRGEPKDLQVAGTYALGMIEGHLVYATATGTLMAVPFDLASGRTTGPPVPVADGITMKSSGAAEAALSPSGVLGYRSGASVFQLTSATLEGTDTDFPAPPRSLMFPRYSPDGTRIAVSLESPGGQDIWVYDLRSKTMSRITTEGTINDRPEWAPDGTRIYFRSNRGDRLAIWSQPVDATGPAAVAVQIPGADVWEGVPTADGRSILFRVGSMGTADIGIRSLVGDTTPRLLVTTPFTEWAARPSPDGRWLAFESDEAGEPQVYVIPLDQPGSRYQVSADGGSEPVWSRDGTRIFYRRETTRFAATIAPGPAFSVAQRDSLFDGEYATWLGHAGYDVAPDGRSLLLLRPITDSNRTIVVYNWAHELSARLADESSP